MRRHILKSENDTISGIRVRGREVSRLEGLTDAVIGFAITLLIVSMEIPTTYDELIVMVMGFPAFGITFLLLVAIWYWHYHFFRQYGLNTKSVVWVNGILLFVVLLFVYPLKFLATIVVNHVILEGWMGFDMPNLVSIEGYQYPYLHMLYACGFSAVFLCFAWLYRLALKEKEALELTEVEVLHTKHHVTAYFVIAMVPLLSVLIVFYPDPYAAMWAGFSNILIWPVSWWSGMRAKKQIAALEIEKQ